VAQVTQTDVQPELRTLGALYEQTRQRVIGLIRDEASRVRDAASAPVPACAGWRVRDVVAHLSGLATDIEAGNLDGVATEAWTAAQVDARRDLEVGDVLRESDEVGPKLASFLDDFPGRYGAQVVADVTVHEHDIRGALRRPGARDSAAVAHSVEFLLETFVAPAAQALAVPALVIQAGDLQVLVGGSGREPGDPTKAAQEALATWSWPPVRERQSEAKPASGAVARLEAPLFELLRALTGRRSLAQVHRLGWSVAPEPWGQLFGNLWPFTVQPEDLVE
jgi:hypothetical protein